MSLLAQTLPSGDGYVAAAYVVFFVLVLAYVAIMAVRLARVERKLKDMQDQRQREPDRERELV
jgi:CcmD family protein